MTPISFLSQAFNKAIMERWHNLQKDNRLKLTDPKDLQLALSYLNTQAARVVKVEYRKQEKKDSPKPINTTENESTGLSPLESAILGVILVAILGGLFAYLATHPQVLFAVLLTPVIAYIFIKTIFYLAIGFANFFNWLSRFIPFDRLAPKRSKFALMAIGYILMIVYPALTLHSYEGVTIISTLLPALIIIISFISIESKEVLAPVLGHQTWLYSIDSAMVESERMAIMTALSESTSAVGMSAEQKDSMPEDHDLDTAKSTPLPAPPGITEIVMEDSPQETFNAMRRHLVSVRNYHRVVLWSLIIAFLTFFAVSIFKFISPSTTVGDYIKAFGSAGVGGALVWFGSRVLWANRISQLSLALFESHVQEVHSSFYEMPNNISSENRRTIRSEIWSNFRTGVNAIWLSENDMMNKNANNLSKKNNKSKAEPGA